MEEKAKLETAILESIQDLDAARAALEYTLARLKAGEITTEQATTLRANYCRCLARIAKEGGAR